LTKKKAKRANTSVGGVASLVGFFFPFKKNPVKREFDHRWNGGFRPSLTSGVRYSTYIWNPWGTGWFGGVSIDPSQNRNHLNRSQTTDINARGRYIQRDM